MRWLAAFFAAGALFLACTNDNTLAPPINLVVAQVGAAASLAWEGAADADSYEVQRSDDIDNSFRDWAETPHGQRYYSDFTVLPNHQYYYRVCAVYGGQRSPFTRSVGIYIK